MHHLLITLLLLSSALCIEEGIIPVFNFCAVLFSLNVLSSVVFSVVTYEVMIEVMDCFLGSLPEKPSKDFKETMDEVFPGLDMASAMQLLCKNNDDDGYTLLATWLDEIDDELRTAAIKAVWICYKGFNARGLM